MARDGGSAAPARPIRLIEATPKVSLGPSASIAVDVRAETVTPDGRGEDRGSITVRPGETPWVLDPATARWTQLESFDLFGLASVDGTPMQGDGPRGRRVQADITGEIGRLAGLDRLGRRLRAPRATVEVDDTVTIRIESRYAPYRDGEVMGEERSLLSDRLNEVDTRARVGSSRRLDLGRGRADAADPSRRARRTGCPGQGGGGARRRRRRAPAGGGQPGRWHRHRASGGLARGSVRAASERLGSHRQLPRGWCTVVGGGCLWGVARRAPRALLGDQPVGATGPDGRRALRTPACFRALVDASAELDAEPATWATRVAGAVRLARRVDELHPASAT